ncbi:MAG: L,D-transpeptidase [Elusimicrobiales bacterium]|nr:L,D-transpeptidase [Elusimicrobiales bacterium]
MKTILAFAALVLGSAPAFSLDFVSIQKQLPALGVNPAQLAQPGPVPAPAPGEDQLLSALQAEALADPAGFIDSHSPDEVALAFGLRPSRFQITDPKRIENALVKITIYLDKQRVNVQAKDFDDTFKISSGLLPKNGTPGSGKCFAPDFIEEMHYSSLYNKAPMPHSVFFNGNIAMHGTNAEHLLGQPASHGCIRLSKADAKTLYTLVKANGKANAAICVRGVTPAPKP